MELSKNHKNGFKLNVLLMIGLSLFVLGFIVYVVGTSKAVFKPKHMLYMTLSNIEGLLPGAYITISGMKVGVIGNMQLELVDDEHVIAIELRIDRSYKDIITVSSVAELKTLGMLGDKYVDITPGNINDPPIPERGFIASKPILDMNSLIVEAAQTLTKIETILDDVKRISAGIADGSSAVGRLLTDSGTGESVEQIVRSLRNVATQLDNGEGTAGKMLRDTLIYTYVLNSVNELHSIIDGLQKGKGTLGRMLTDSTLFYQASSIVAQTDTLLQHIHEGGTTGRLINDEELYEQLVEIIHTLDVLLKDVKENPKRYVRFKLF
jgi:phospholipid/cholesterol/gamma-HCH transport system substrate-binding protein